LQPFYIWLRQQPLIATAIILFATTKFWWQQSHLSQPRMKMVARTPPFATKSHCCTKKMVALGLEVSSDISKSIRKKLRICLSMPLAGLKILESPNLPLTFEFSPHKVFSHFLQSSENFVGHVFHLFKLKFSVVTSLVLLSKRKISKK